MSASAQFDTSQIGNAAAPASGTFSTSDIDKPNVAGAQASPHPQTLPEALQHQGFLDSAWNAIKSMANPFGSMSMSSAVARDADLSKAFDAKTDDERRDAVRDILLKNVPLASTLYKVATGNVSGALGDIAPAVALGVAGGIAANPEIGSVVKGTAKGAVEGATKTVPLRRYGMDISVPAPMAGAAAGGVIGGMTRIPYAGEVGAVVGAAAPIVRGAMRGFKNAVEAARAVNTEPVGPPGFGIAGGSTLNVPPAPVAGAAGYQPPVSGALPSEALPPAPFDPNAQIGNASTLSAPKSSVPVRVVKQPPVSGSLPTPVEAMAQKGSAVQFTPQEEALAQHIMQSTEPQSISSALNLPASASPRVPLQPPLARPTSISLAEALRQEMLRSGTLDASKEAGATESSAPAPVPQGPLDAGFRSLPANVRKAAADANYRAQMETGGGVPGGQAYEAAARANKVDPLVENLSTKLQENGISANDAGILRDPQFKPHWAALAHELGIKQPGVKTVDAVIQELQRREAAAK